MCDWHFLQILRECPHSILPYGHCTRVFLRLELFFLPNLHGWFHSHTSSFSQVSSLLKGHFWTTPSKSLLLLCSLIMHCLFIHFTFIVYSCGFMWSLSFPQPHFLGTEDSIGTGAQSRCLLKFADWRMILVLGLESNPRSPESYCCCTLAIACFHHTIYWIIFCLLSMCRISLHMA